MRAMIDQAGLTGRVVLDSAGTSGWHAGEPPDSRATAAARNRGYDLSSLRARPVGIKDFMTFDFLLALDHGHFETLAAMRPPGARGKIAMFLEGSDGGGSRDVPDPYGREVEAFNHALDLIETGCGYWLARVQERLATGAPDRTGGGDRLR